MLKEDKKFLWRESWVIVESGESGMGQERPTRMRLTEATRTISEHATQLILTYSTTTSNASFTCFHFLYV